jgi:hypothetical protein
MGGFANSKVVLKFTDASIPLKVLFEGTSKDSIKTRKEHTLLHKLQYASPTKRNKAAFYVLRLPHCVEAIKIGRANIDIKARLKGYYNAFGDSLLLYARTFEKNDPSVTSIQPVNVFERKVINMIKEKNIPSLRGNEYFDVKYLKEIEQIIINATLSQAEVAHPPKRIQPTRKRVLPKRLSD